MENIAIMLLNIDTKEGARESLKDRVIKHFDALRKNAELTKDVNKALLNKLVGFFKSSAGFSLMSFVRDEA